MNISDIAKMAEVSRAAVSRYFNKGYVSEEKKERIKKVIQETGYRPSASAQALRTKKSKLIGVIVPKISSESISKIVNGLSEGLKKQGYHMLLGNTENDASQELEFMRVFENNNVDGIVLIATELTQEHRNRLEELKIPVVLIGQRLEGYHCIYHDDYHAARELAGLFFQSEVKNPGYIGVTEEDKAVGSERKCGFLDAASQFQVEVKPECMICGAFRFENGYQGMKAILEANPETDGVFCVTDTIATGAMEYLKEKGMQIPKQVAVVGMGDSRLSSLITPKLTTVHYYYEESGAEASRILLGLLGGEEISPKEIVLGYEVVPRESLR